MAIFIVADARIVIDGHSTKAGPNHLVVVPKGAGHNVVGTGPDALKRFSVYAPPAEPEGAAFKTKAADAVKAAVGR